jgi:asparagine synthetase B (glutamine-hydrolysing)
MNNYAIPYVLNFLNSKSNPDFRKLKVSFIKDFKSKLSKFENLKYKQKKTYLKEFLISRILKTHIPYWLRIDDEISMLNSIENRVPYLDHQIVEFCMQIKTQFFYKKGLNKFFFRKAIKKELPDFILNQKKIGKPGSSHIATYTILKNEIFRIIDSNFLKNYVGLSKVKLKKKFTNDLKINNKIKADYWFRVFFLYKWLMLQKIN